MKYNRKVVGDAIIISDESGREVLKINEKPSEHSMEYTVEGELNNDIAYELEDELIAGISVRKKLDIDMRELTYIASSGIRSLLKVQHMIDERTGYEMILRGVNPLVKDIMKKNGFFDLFKIEE